jgi:hypothetical protein
MNNSFRVWVLILLIFNGISAIIGGSMLILKPDGSSIGMPPDMIMMFSNSPFGDFLVPGIILVIMNGISSFVSSVPAIHRTKNYYLFVIYQGCVLTVWIAVQIYFIPTFHFLQITYGLIGIVMIILGIFIGKQKVVSTR